MDKLVGFLLISGYLIVSGTSYDLTILHTNDVHARVVEAHKYGGICKPEQSADGDCVGGAARLYTKIKEIRNTTENVLLLDGGDQFQGTFWFFVYQGLATAQVMKKLGYDAMALGNHEFDLGLPALQKFVNNVSASVNILSANIDNSNEVGLVGYSPYIIREVAGRNIGIVGYTTTDTPLLTKLGSTGNLVFREIIQSIKDAVAEIKLANSSINIFIAVGHAGFEVDMQIAQEVEEIDVVVGGHTNTFLWTGDKPSSETPIGEYPYSITRDSGKIALCVQAYTFSKYLGNLNVVFNDDGDVTGYSGNPILLNSLVAKDPEVEAMLAPYKERIEAEGNIPIARTSVKLDSSCRRKECNFGNLILDAWIHTNILFGTDMKWARAAIAVVNGGSIRSPIERGNITNSMVLTALPFSNDIVSVTVSGKTLKSVFEWSARANDLDSTSGRFLQMSGAHVKYNLENAVGKRVVDLRLRCLNCDIPTFEPIDLNANYTILTSSFTATGGDGYGMLVNERLDFENLGLMDSAMVDEYMRALGTVYPTEEGRIQYVTSQKDECPKSPDPVDSSAISVKFGFYFYPLFLVIYFILFCETSR